MSLPMENKKIPAPVVQNSRSAVTNVSKRRQSENRKKSEDEYKSTEELRFDIQRERAMAKLLHKSADQWKDIVADFAMMEDDISSHGDDFKIRYENQRAMNQMLQKQIVAMVTELRSMSQGLSRLPRCIDLNKTSEKEYRVLNRQLDMEKSSLISMYRMYERQLDVEAMAYHKAKDQSKGMAKDIRYQQKLAMQKREEIDKEIISKFRESEKKAANSKTSQAKGPENDVLRVRRQYARKSRDTARSRKASQPEWYHRIQPHSYVEYFKAGKIYPKDANWRC